MIAILHRAALLIGLLLCGVVLPAAAAEIRAAELRGVDATGLQTVADEPELTTDLVERYLATMRDLREFAVRAQAEQEEEGFDQEAARELQAEQAAILDDHGFAQDEWMAVHERVFEAAMADAMRRQVSEEEIEQQFAEQQARIREQDELPQDQREMMLEQLDQQMELVRELQANPDIEVVAPYHEEFQELFGDGM